MGSEGEHVIRVGSRKSELALIQTNFVIDSLKKVYPQKEFSLVSMTTLGDRILNVSLPKIGEKSLFTKDLEDALRERRVDFVVHSLKDLPTSLPDGLAIGAVLEREDPRDALVLREDLKEHTLSTLPEGSVIGTSSLRRAAQLRSSYPQLAISDVRGNLNTRLRKLDTTGDYSALILATAGLHRMGWTHRITKVLGCSELLYAVGQGALAVECRADDEPVLALLAAFSDPATYCRVLAERSFLNALGGGCSAPVGVSTRLKPFDNQHKLTITGAVWSLDGKIKIVHTLERTFAQITKGQKHKLSPNEENEYKKIKHEPDGNSIEKQESGNGNTDNETVEQRNRITDKSGDLVREHTRGAEELENLTKEGKTRIFCGMTENINVPLDVIVQCDSFGRDLAKELITQGALEVMKVTQDLIRSSTVKQS